MGLALLGAAAAPAAAATWEYSNNGKGNHYLMATFARGSATFACNGQKVIGFFSLPATAVGEDFKRAKLVYSVARIDGDEDGNGTYVWFSGKPDTDDGDFNSNLESSQPLLIKLLRDMQGAATEIAFGVSLDNPAKGRFKAGPFLHLDVDGIGDAVGQLFEACKIK
jgi:hypothetical protein